MTQESINSKATKYTKTFLQIDMVCTKFKKSTIYFSVEIMGFRQGKRKRENKNSII